MVVPCLYCWQIQQMKHMVLYQIKCSSLRDEDEAVVDDEFIADAKKVRMKLMDLYLLYSK